MRFNKPTQAKMLKHKLGRLFIDQHLSRLVVVEQKE